MIRKSQRATAERRETGAENHAVVRVFGRGDDFLFEAARRFVDHEEDKTVRERFAISNRTRRSRGISWRFLEAFVRRTARAVTASLACISLRRTPLGTT